MTVVKSKRGESDLTVVTKARELASYTLHICSNEKNFPKRYRWCITSDIVKDALEIHRNIRKANAVYVSIKSDYDTRRQYQNKAISSIDALLGDMDIAYVTFFIKTYGRSKRYV